MIRKLRRALVIAVLFAAIGNQVQAAPAVPDTTDLLSTRGYGDVVETGDILLILRYDIDYTSLPTESASEAVVGRYLDGNTPVRTSAPFVFVRSGYGNGVIAVYFDSADAATLSLAHGDVDSGEIMGNPSFFTAPWSKKEPITWVSLADQTQLELDLAEIAIDLEEKTEWDGINLIQFDSGKNILQTEGEDYFENSIPRIRQAAPRIFAATLGTPTFSERTFTQSYQTSLEGAWGGSRLEGSFTSLAAWLDMPETAVTTTLVLIGAMVAAGMLGAMAIKQGVTTENAGGMGLVVVAIIIGLAAFQGLFNLVFLAIIGFFGLLLIAATLWLKRA